MAPITISKPATSTASNAEERKNLVLATKRGLSVLRGIKKLGGLTGYQKWLTQPHTVRPHLAVKDFPNVVAATCDFWAALIYEELSIETADGHKGSGSAWGVGIGGFEGVGALMYSDWATLTSKPNDFYIIAGGEEAGAITVFFLVDGNLVANGTFVGEGLGGVIGLDGTFDWS